MNLVKFQHTPARKIKEMKHRNYKIVPKNQCQPMRLAVMHASRHHWSSITTHFYLSETLVICSLSHEFPKYLWHPYSFFSLCSRRCISKAPFVRKRENQQTQPAQGPRGNTNIPRYVQGWGTGHETVNQSRKETFYGAVQPTCLWRMFCMLSNQVPCFHCKNHTAPRYWAVAY